MQGLKKDELIAIVVFAAIFFGLWWADKNSIGFITGFLSVSGLIETAISTVIFVIFCAILSKAFFVPQLTLLEEREARTTGDQSLAGERRRESGALEDEIEVGLRDARLSAMAERDAVVQKAKEEAAKIVSEASARAEEELARRKEMIDALKLKAGQDVDAEAQKLAELVVERALSTPGATTVH